jgi:hypothetical protein
MFSWFRRKKSAKRGQLPPVAENPGVSVTAKFAFSNGERNWTEEVNAVEAAAVALTNRGYAIVKHEACVEHPESGFVFHPQLAEIHPLQEGGVRTVTTIAVRHPQLVPDGIFEFQHATGDASQASLVAGFDLWVQVDLVALLDAARDTPGECMLMQMTFPAKEGSPELSRRAVLGPVMHYAESPAQVPVGGGEGDGHTFCPCCLLTNSFEAFKSLLEVDAFCGIRLYAARDEHGVASADCRVNGADWDIGKRALKKYVATWPERGFEFRKQYVVLQTK